MSEREIYSALKKIDCCNICILRHLGSKNYEFYSDVDAYFTKLKLIEESQADVCESADVSIDSEEPMRKRARLVSCSCCLGLLQPQFWTPVLSKVISTVNDSGYVSNTFACALSFPMSLLLREHSVQLYLQEEFTNWKPNNVTSLKEAWKWSFGPKMAAAVEKTMDSGAVCPFLIQVFMQYEHDVQELATLRAMLPKTFAERERSHRKFNGELFTKKSIEVMLSELDNTDFRRHFPSPPLPGRCPAECASVQCSHTSVFVAGRYQKFSRELSQTPWLLDGKRIMESSVQDILFEPISKVFNIPQEEASSRLKFLSSGREDVDVRCLGRGRPFAVEVLEPRASPSPQQLQQAQAAMAAPGLVAVTDLQLVSRDELTILKKGEETKSKTYRALCIKLPKSKEKVLTENEMKASATLTEEDLRLMNTFSNSEDGTVIIQQKTPMRVLHRRPLLVRDRKILKMTAAPVQGRPNMFLLELETQAGTYIKEFVHGDFGRTVPSLSSILTRDLDILALDVISVNLDWPRRLDAECMPLN